MWAGKLRFEDKPDTEVRFVEGPDRSSVSASDRHNLPHQVEDHVDYDGVRVHYVLASQLDPKRYPDR